jgi:LPS export ABC transporter protein LptC
MKLPARAALGAALLLAVAACSGGKTVEPAQSPAAVPSAAASPATPRPGPSTVPIALAAHKVGSKYIYLTKQKGNRRIYILRADAETGQYFGANTGRSQFTRPHITFYGAAGKRLTADAPLGTVVERDKTVTMTGGVSAVDQDGTTLTCDSLRYDDPTEQLHGQGNVRLRSPQGDELRGETLDWNLHDGQLSVRGAS